MRLCPGTLAAAGRPLAACLVMVSAATALQRTYDGYRVYDVSVGNFSQSALLHHLAARSGLELWGEDDAAGTLQLQVAPRAAEDLESRLNASGLQYSLRIENVQRLIDDQETENSRSTQARGRSLEDNSIGDGGGGFDGSFASDDTSLDGFRLDVYHTWQEIDAFLQMLSARYPHSAQLEQIGRTHEGRPLHVLRLREDTATPAHKPVMWIDCGIHAREWISPAICLYAISRLLSSPEGRHHLAHYDWHIMPMMNPDGYVYTHTHDRLWRKNRKPGHYCTGVDLNRNFAARWGTFGVTFLECGMTFPGYSAFSERESRAVRDAVLRDRARIVAFSSLHSYGQLWLLPYGYSWLPSRHVRQQRRVGRAATRAIRAVNGVQYRYGISSRMLYLDSGTSTDWAYHAGVKHSVAVEARDKGYYGFLLPPRLIMPTVREVWAGLAAQADVLVR